jgi:hypothetical protein
LQARQIGGRQPRIVAPRKARGDNRTADDERERRAHNGVNALNKSD